MFLKIKRELKIYKWVSKITTRLCILMLTITLLLFLERAIVYNLRNNTYKNDLNNDLNVMVRPILQISEINKKSSYIFSDKGIILNKNSFKLYNTTLKSDEVNAFSKTVFIFQDKDEIVLTERPYIIFNNQ